MNAKNYAAQIGNKTVITRAFKRENALKFMQSKDAAIKDKDVYVYEGTTGATPIDEVYTTQEREIDATGQLVWKDVPNVRFAAEYAHLTQ